jgi:hypothetical protein
MRLYVYMPVRPNCRNIFLRNTKDITLIIIITLILTLNKTSISFKLLFFAVNVTFLEVEVHIAKIHLLGLNITSFFWLASFGLEMFMLIAIGDNLHLPIVTLLHVARFEDVLE